MSISSTDTQNNVLDLHGLNGLEAKKAFKSTLSEAMKRKGKKKNNSEQEYVSILKHVKLHVLGLKYVGFQVYHDLKEYGV